MKIRITKSQASGLLLKRTTDGYITNGHWAVRESLASFNRTKDQRWSKAFDIDRALADLLADYSAETPVQRTGRGEQHGFQTEIFTGYGPDAEITALHLQQAYARLLPRRAPLVALGAPGEPPSAVATEDRAVVVMGLR